MCVLRVNGSLIKLDDIIPMAAEDAAVELLRSLGLFVNWENSSIEPSTEKEFIGYILSTDNPDLCVWIKIPTSRNTKVCRDIKRALGNGTC